MSRVDPVGFAQSAEDVLKKDTLVDQRMGSGHFTPETFPSRTCWPVDA